MAYDLSRLPLPLPVADLPAYLRSNAEVIQIDHLKEKDSDSEHEYLMVHVKYHGRVRQFRVERKPGYGKKEQASNLFAPNLRRAADTIDLVHDHGLETWHISTAMPTQGTTGMTLVEFAHLCAQVTESAPKYHILSHNCYWYCREVLRKVKNSSRFLVHHGQDNERRGCYSEVPEIVVRKVALDVEVARTTYKTFKKIHEIHREFEDAVLDFFLG